MNRVPTHAVTVPNERRAYPRASLCLQARVLRIAGRREPQGETFRTLDISSSGLRARCPFGIEVGTPVNLEVELVRRATGSGTVRLMTEAHVVRVETEKKSGWHTLAFNFDDITFERDDFLPPSFSGH
jgi:c-di-GMP-binding flagellar brake protein YcgR